MTALRGILTSEMPVAPEAATEAMNSLLELALKPQWLSISQLSAERLLELNAQNNFLELAVANGLNRVHDDLPVALPAVAALRKIEDYPEGEVALVRQPTGESFAKGRIIISGLERIVGTVAVGLNGVVAHCQPGYVGLMNAYEHGIYERYRLTDPHPRWDPTFMNLAISRALTMAGVTNSCSASTFKSMTRTRNKKDYHKKSIQPELNILS